MSSPILFWLQLLAALAYSGAAARQWAAFRSPGRRPVAPGLIIGALGLVLHTVTVTAQVLAGGRILHLDLAYAFSLFLWLAILQFLTSSLFLRIHPLGLILFPLGALMLLAEALAPSGDPLLKDPGQPLLLGHLILSLVAYGTLTLAAGQALLLGCQESQLRRKRIGLLARFLPPMQPMERLLFHLLRVGFGLLTLVIISGALFSEQIFGQPLTFNHKVVLTLFAWVVFGLLLWGHRRYGWRGRAAVQWTLSGYGLLLLAYFGVRVILELKA